MFHLSSHPHYRNDSFLKEDRAGWMSQLLVVCFSTNSRIPHISFYNSLLHYIRINTLICHAIYSLKSYGRTSIAYMQSCCCHLQCLHSSHIKIIIYKVFCIIITRAQSISFGKRHAILKNSRIPSSFWLIWRCLQFHRESMIQLFLLCYRKR